MTRKYVIMLDGERFYAGPYNIGLVSYCDSEAFAFKFGTTEDAFKNLSFASDRTYDCDGNKVDPKRLDVYEMKFEKVTKGEVE